MFKSDIVDYLRHIFIEIGDYSRDLVNNGITLKLSKIRQVSNTSVTLFWLTREWRYAKNENVIK